MQRRQVDTGPINESVADLTPEQRALLTLRLRKNTSVTTEVSQTGSIRPIPRDGQLSLSFAQERLWFLNRLLGGGPLYNIHAAVLIDGGLKIAVLEQCLGEIVRRHESLRTIFPAVNGQPVQVITAPETISLDITDLSGLSETERDSEARRLALSEAQRPFDLGGGPLFRARLLSLSGQKHVVLITMHHIVSDAWSVSVLNNDLTALYQAYSIGLSSPLSDLEIQYADFAAWQRQRLGGESLKIQLDYWKRQLADATPMLRLPTDRPRPEVRTYRGARQMLRLSGELSDKLRGLSRREGATLFITLLSVFKVLLQRYVGEDDIVVGVAIANRNWAELEKLVGFFVNTLVLRTDLSGPPTFKELLGRVREVTLSADAHQDLPFEKLVKELQPARNLSFTSMFQVGFGLQNVSMHALSFTGLNLSPMGINIGTSKFDLNLAMVDTKGGMAGSLEYNTDLFDCATVTRLLHHYHALLKAVVLEPLRPISGLPLTTESERHHLLVEWNDAGRRQPLTMSLLSLFNAQVETRPDSVAIVCEDAQVTYLELNRRTNQLAHRLRSLGVAAETLVGILMERSENLIVAILAVVKSGGAYLPLDPSYPGDRLAFMIEDARIKVLLVQEPPNKEMVGVATQIISLETDWETIAGEVDDNLGSGAGEDNLAYVIYTSGSTGAPKGVMVSHSNVTRLFSTAIPLYRFDERDVWTLFHSCSFDFSVWELWGGLLWGGRVVIVPYPVSRSLADFAELLRREQVTVLNQTPSAFRQIVQAEYLSPSTADLSLRLVIFGGEAMDASMLRPWYATGENGRPRFCNMYGITETTVHVTYRALGERDLNPHVGSVIGRPLDDLQVYILDRAGELDPIGVAGELYVSGGGVARGYLNRPALTAERFSPRPFGDRGGERVYRTGDLGRYLPNGEIEYLGRVDHQVKVRGFRVELGEIEAALGSHESVKHAVVVAREDVPGDKRLIAYVVPEEGAAPTIGELRRALQKRLPDYMIPAAFITLDRIPLTAQGKLDKQALPAPDQSRQEAQQEFIAPRTPIEEMLAKIWAEILNLERVGVNDNFFELGGHSLLMTQIVSRARNTIGVELPMQSFFQEPTVAGLALVITQLKAAEKESDEVAQLLDMLDQLSEDDLKVWVERKK